MQKSEVNPEKQNPYMDQGLTLKKFFDSAPMMMGVVELEDNDIRHISDNHASAKFFGISVEELEGKFSSELGVPRHAIDLWLKHYHLAEETNSPASFEYELHNNNLLATVSFIGRNPAGVSRFSYILQDVTETREAQNKLKALNRNLELRIDERTKELNIEKNKLACLLNASPIGIAFLDTDLKYDIINPVLARMNGYDQQEHKKMTVYDVIPEDAHNLAPLLKDVIRTGKSILNLEYDSFAKTNRLGTFLANYFPVQLEGKVIGIGATVVDITQRKKSELESKQNELRYRLVVDGIKDHAIIRFDSIGRIIDWNPGAELIFGHKKLDVIGKHGRILFTQEDIDKGVPEQEINEAIHAGKADDNRWQIKKDGSLFFASGIMNPLIDQEGDVYGFVKVLRDETSRKKSDDRVNEALKLFYSLAETVPSIIWISSPETGIEYVNKRWLEYTGLTLDESKGHGFESAIFEEDLRHVERKYHDDKSERKQLIRVKRHDGIYRWHISDGVPIKDESGKIIRWVGCTTDVHDQKEINLALEKAKHDLSNVLNAIPLSITRIDKDERFVFANENNRSYFGPPENIIGKTLKELFGEKYPMMEKDIKAALSGERVEFEYSTSTIRDNKLHHFMVTYTPEKDVEGNVFGFISSLFNIDDLRATYAELNVQKNNLEEERELRERFVTALSHDLRTPLAAAKMTNQMLRRSYPNEDKIIKYTERVIGSIDRVDSMIQDLLDANLIKAGEKLPVKPENCSLSLVVHSTIDDLVHIHGPRFIFQEHDRDINGYWDCNGVRRILENLCNNAVKYGAPDRPVTVSIRNFDKDTIEILVHNEGNPIAERDQNQLFTPFRRMNSAHESGKKGWGIGLTLVRGVVEAHGGSISVESSLELGTIFQIRLPKNSVS